MPVTLKIFSMTPGSGLAAGLAAALLFSAVAPAGAAPANVWVRTILHADGSRTVSKKDTGSRVIEQMTYGINDVLIMKRIVQLDERGKSRRGFIFDGEHNLIYKIGYFYDEIDRLKEEVLYNTNEVVVRRVIHSYDAKGNPLTPKAFNFNDAAPAVAARALTPEAALAGAEQSAAGAQMRGTMPAAPEQPKKKKRFRLFRRK